MNADPEKRIFSIPNLLSTVRICLVPMFLFFILKAEAAKAFLVFLAAGATDALDGFIARFFHQKTKLGQFLDPAGDKILMSASFIALSIPSLGYANVIPLWLTGWVFGRDLLIATGSFVLFRMTSKEKIHVTLLGKITTVCQMGVVLLVLFFNWRQASPSFLQWLFFLTLVFTIASGVSYTLQGIRLYKSR